MKAVFTFGRFNPPTVGHQKLVDKVRSVARLERGEPLVYMSHSQDKKKNPIGYMDKVKLGQKAFGKLVQRSNSNTIIKILQELEKKYDEVVLVVGSDRVDSMRDLLNKYNGKDYEFQSIEVVSAGERDPDADDVSGMSASKMRAAASADDFEAFKGGLPPTIQRDAQKIFDMVRKEMGIREDVEENYADGKIKGKSRPGRVKRAGVDCKKSKSELRKIAKNSSGEKQKMAHWCANMKKEDNPCWDGYKKVPGKKDYEKGSCEKEQVEEGRRSAQSRLDRRAAKLGLGKPNKAADDYIASLMKKYGAKDMADLKKKMKVEEVEEGKNDDKPLNKVMKGDVKKSKVYVKDPKTGNVKKVEFGDPNMSIKKDQPGRKKSFRARHKCDQKKDKTTAGYWSCKAWEDWRAEDQMITEAFDKPYKYKLKRKGPTEYTAQSRLDDGTILDIEFTAIDWGDYLSWNVVFMRNYEVSMTGEGDAMRIFATVLSAVKDFIKAEKPEEIRFTAEKHRSVPKDERSSREKLYSRLVKTFAKKLGYDSYELSTPGDTTYYLTKK